MYCKIINHYADLFIEEKFNDEVTWTTCHTSNYTRK